MSLKRSRREFVKASAAAGLAATLSGRRLLRGESDKRVRLVFVGVGARGSGLLKIALTLPGVEIPAICDINVQNLEKNLREVEKDARKRPEGYSNGEEDYKRMVTRDDLDAIITATPWELHTPVMVAAMKAGKYGATEVGAAVSVEQCWDLVRTSESTKMPCMMLENTCYERNVMAVLNMVRQGVLGELVHCEAGYEHDVRAHGLFDKKGELRWRANHYVKGNGNLYPTHPIGPAAHWMNINRGDRFTYLVSMSSKSRGLKHYIKKRFGADHPNAKRKYAMGDVNTTLIKTHNGLTITLYFDTQSPRPYDLIWRLQGTEGIYSWTPFGINIGNKPLGKFYIEDKSPQKPEETWEPAEKYVSEFEHPLWKGLGETSKKHGHGGNDYLVMAEFVKAVREKTQTPIDVYDSATWSVIYSLSQESVANRSIPVDFPDFTQGKWKTNTPSFGLVTT